MWPFPSFIYPDNPVYVLASLGISLLLDYVYPFHSGFMLSVHPVHTAFVMARRLGRPGSSRVRGVLTWLAVMITHLGFYALILWLAWLLSPIAWVIASSYILKVSASLKLLLDTVEGVRSCALRGDWVRARELAQGIVRRDLSVVGEGLVLSAAVESLAESLVDGFTSPLMYYALLGPLGALAQRIVNTLDGALGFRFGGYERVGWFSALADTVLNYLPARLTAFLIAASSLLRDGLSASKVFRCWLRECGGTESVNAGHPIAAMAAALGVRLEKLGHYVISCGDSLPSPEDVGYALRVSKVVAASWVAAVSAASLLLTSLA